MNNKLFWAVYCLILFLCPVVLLVSVLVAGGGDLDCAESGTRGTVQWDRYTDSDGSIDERPNPKAGFDTVRLTICNDGTVRGRIDRTAPRR